MSTTPYMVNIWVADGLLTAHDIGGRVMLDLEEVLELMNMIPPFKTSR